MWDTSTIHTANTHIHRLQAAWEALKQNTQLQKCFVQQWDQINEQQKPYKIGDSHGLLLRAPVKCN